MEKKWSDIRNEKKPPLFMIMTYTKKWGIFENYFKAGNYFTSLDKRILCQG
jgi:hypothetical protein